MAEWFNVFASGHEFRSDAARALREDGFVVLPGLMPCWQVERLRRAYDAAAASAVADDVRVGSTTTRVNDFVNRGVEFDAVYVLPALLEACCQIIGRPFKLSSLHARTLRPYSPMSELHVDVRRDSMDWPLAGFILMIDEFRPDNGATRFVPGSHRWPNDPVDVMPDRRASHDGQVIACGPAGSFLLFNGSAWHGHTANVSGGPRRSLRARSSRGMVAPELISRRGCDPRHSLALRPWRGTCWRSEAPRHEACGLPSSPSSCWLHGGTRPDSQTPRLVRIGRRGDPLLS